MKEWKVPGMHCARCVERIVNALGAAGIEARVTLANQTVAVEQERAGEAKEILDDLGFEIE